MTNKRNSVRIAHEAILLVLYVWNSCPILGAIISHSLAAVGCKFAFPINYLTNKHWELTFPLIAWNLIHKTLQHALPPFVKLPIF